SPKLLASRPPAPTSSTGSLLSAAGSAATSSTGAGMQRNSASSSRGPASPRQGPASPRSDLAKASNATGNLHTPPSKMTPRRPTSTRSSNPSPRGRNAGKLGLEKATGASQPPSPRTSPARQSVDKRSPAKRGRPGATSKEAPATHKAGTKEVTVEDTDSSPGDLVNDEAVQGQEQEVDDLADQELLEELLHQQASFE
ncbi:unnamed protein product, partial [Polarella glacialis]